VQDLIEFPESPNLYRTMDFAPYPLVNGTPWDVWLEQCEDFCNDPLKFQFLYHMGEIDPFFTNVAQPMYAAWKIRKEGKGTGLAEVGNIMDKGWRIACTEWIMRRELAKQS